ncbi:MAG: hypothetical protein ACYSUF_09430 [Planctomycetota bacterium]
MPHAAPSAAATFASDRPEATFDPDPHVLSRWLAFLFLAMLMLIVIIALSTATLAV